jgi:hypothetical protein
MAGRIYCDVSNASPGATIYGSVDGMEDGATFQIVVSQYNYGMENTYDQYANNLWEYTIPDDATDTIQLELYTYNGPNYSGDPLYMEWTRQDVIKINIIKAFGAPLINKNNSRMYAVYNGKELPYAIQGITNVKVYVDVDSGDVGGYHCIPQYGNLIQEETSTTNMTFDIGVPTIFNDIIYCDVIVYGQDVSQTDVYNAQITCYEYSEPYFTYFRAYRSDAQGVADMNGLYITYEYQANCSPVGGHNEITKINIVCDGTSIKTLTPTNTDDINYGRYTTSKYYTNSDDETQHSLYAVAYDSYNGNSTSSTATIYGSIRSLNIYKDGTGFAIGKLSSGPNKFECRWDASFDGNVTVAGTVNSNGSPSDERVKKNVQTVNIDIVSKLRPIQYQLKNSNDTKNHYGFIAQEVIKAFADEGIDLSTAGLIGNALYHGIDIYTLKYEEFIPLLVIKCQSLQKELDDLKSEIKALKESS